MGETTDWRNGVRIVRGAAVETEMRDPAGIGRATAAQFSGGGTGNVWIGTVTLAPATSTGAHHHAHHEVLIQVMRGTAEIRWGARLEFASTIEKGDFAYFAPQVPHQERNPSAAEPVDFLVVRTDAARLAVKLDADPVVLPETVA
jgi:uncharacterized RmlC-like cupin family protein